MKLATTDTDFSTLEKTVDGARDGSVFVKVDKGSLKRLLSDHSELVSRVRSLGGHFDAGDDQRSLA